MACAYDLVIDTVDGFKKLQIKSREKLTSGNKVKFKRRNTRSGWQPYTSDEVDFFIIVRGGVGKNNIYIIPYESAFNDKVKWGNYLWFNGRRDVLPGPAVYGDGDIAEETNSVVYDLAS